MRLERNDLYSLFTIGTSINNEYKYNTIISSELANSVINVNILTL